MRAVGADLRVCPDHEKSIFCYKMRMPSCWEKGKHVGLPVHPHPLAILFLHHFQRLVSCVQNVNAP